MGACSRCGECCRWLVIGFEKNLTNDQRRYYTFRGMVIRQGLVMISHPCKALQYIHPEDGTPVGEDEVTPPNIESGTIISKCLVHDAKPEICRLYKGKKRAKGIVFYVPGCCTMKE